MAAVGAGPLPRHHLGRHRHQGIQGYREHPQIAGRRSGRCGRYGRDGSRIVHAKRQWNRDVRTGCRRHGRRGPEGRADSHAADRRQPDRCRRPRRRTERGRGTGLQKGRRAGQAGRHQLSGPIQRIGSQPDGRAKTARGDQTTPRRNGPQIGPQDRNRSGQGPTRRSQSPADADEGRTRTVEHRHADGRCPVHPRTAAGRGRPPAG